MSEEQYALNWNDHSKHLLKAFGNLFTSSDFIDVTLSCQGKRIGAHKVILAACSTYFNQVIRDHPNPHPIIILKGVSYRSMEDILKFMYLGEVQVGIFISCLFIFLHKKKVIQLM